MAGEARGWVVCGALCALSLLACEAGTTVGAGADGDTRDVVFIEVLIPDVPDAADSRDAAEPPDAAPEIVDTIAPDTIGDAAPDVADAPDSSPTETTSPDVAPDTLADAAPETGDAVDATEIAAPFCGDDTCDDGEDCLGCLDCACPERCGGDLFFSEYVEGPTGFNKAVEIMNATGREVDLAQYALWKITNGGVWGESAPLPLTGALAPGDVFVVCHASAAATMLARCDLASATSTLEFNGNDAVGLARQGALVDAIGEAGADPGAAFAAGAVADATKDHRMVRRATVVEGTTDWAAGAAQWDVLVFDDAGLGAHAVAAICDPRLPPPAVLNEVRLGAGADDFVELAAVGGGVDLAGWRIATTGGTYTFPTGASVAAGGFVAVSRATLGFGLGAVDIVWLQDADGAQQDVVGVALADLDDDLSWGRLPDVSGPFQGLSLPTPGAPNQDPDHLCDDGACDDDEGCDTCPEDCGTCTPIAGELVVTEILAEPTAGPEWLEVTSVAAIPLELAGLVLADDGADFHALAPASGSLVIAPGERVVLGSAVAAHVDLVYAGFSLSASADAVVLEGEGETIDRVAWTSAPTAAGVAWSLDPAATDADANDADTAWCEAVDVGPDGQRGTPGGPNPICAEPECGDTRCDPDETCASCPGDCGACAGCATQLFISEYVEGESGSNKKAIEIANFTGQTVNLGQYAIRKISNGGGAWADADTLVLSGTLAHGEVWVVCNTASIAALLALCDATSGSQALNFNGNDAVALAYGSTVIDTIGEETTPDPPAWTVAGVALATQDHVLVRKPAVRAPTTGWTAAAASEWDVLAPSEWSGLGAHTFGWTCTP